MNSKCTPCIMLFLCLSLFCCFGCVLPVEESQTNSFDDSSAAPLESVANASDGIDASDASALLYDGEGLKIYYAYRQGQPGVCVEAVSWGETHRRFQELPYTQGMTDLVFTGVETKSKEERNISLLVISTIRERKGSSVPIRCPPIIPLFILCQQNPAWNSPKSSMICY